MSSASTTNGRTLTGVELDGLTADALDRAIDEVSVYARVNPEHKLRIVEALQRRGAVVAMTGDGVNDAPALKTADIGVAMGITGTDVSKQAADMVLADDNFASIVAAVEEGRAIFSNIRKFLRYLLSSNIGEVMTMFFGVVIGDAIGLDVHGTVVVLPLLATQLLWINLVTDGAPALALGLDPPDRSLMRCPPRPAGERVITPRMWRGIVFVGVVMAAGTLYVLDASLPGGFIDGDGTMRVRADEGVHRAHPVPAVQRLQRQIRHGERVSGRVRQSLALGRRAAVGRAAGRRRVRAVPAAGVLDGTDERRRLAAVCGRREFRAVAAGGGEARRAPHPDAGRQARVRTESLILNPLSPIPNPQSRIANPSSTIPNPESESRIPDRASRIASRIDPHVST